MVTLTNGLPIDIMDEVLGHTLALDRRSLSHFSRTSWQHYDLATPVLYRDLMLQSYMELRSFVMAFERQSLEKRSLRFKLSQKLGRLENVLRPGQRSHTRPCPLLLVKHIYIIPARLWTGLWADVDIWPRAIAIVQRACRNRQTWCLYSLLRREETIRLLQMCKIPRLMIMTEPRRHEHFFPWSISDNVTLPSVTHLFVPNVAGSYRSLPSYAVENYPNLTHLALSCRPRDALQARQIGQTVLALLALSWPLRRLVMYALHPREENLHQTELWRELAGRYDDPRLVIVGLEATSDDEIESRQCTTHSLIDQWTMFARDGDKFW